MVLRQKPRLAEDPRVRVRRRANVRWVEAGGEREGTWVAVYPDEDEEGR